MTLNLNPNKHNPNKAIFRKIPFWICMISLLQIKLTILINYSIIKAICPNRFLNKTIKHWVIRDTNRCLNKDSNKCLNKGSNRCRNKGSNRCRNRDINLCPNKDIINHRNKVSLLALNKPFKHHPKIMCTR